MLGDKREGQKQVVKDFLENRMCTSVRTASKPNITVILKSMESAERFTSPSSPVAAEIKGTTGEQVEL